MLWCRMISAFGSGAAFSLVSGMASGNKLQGAFTTGTLFALFQGVFFVVRSSMCTRPSCHRCCHPHHHPVTAIVPLCVFAPQVSQHGGACTDSLQVWLNRLILLMQLGKKFKRGPAVEELPEYARATHFLGTLGMQNYQKNLKRGLLNDSTLHLWNERYCLYSHTMMSRVDSFMATQQSASG